MLSKYFNHSTLANMSVYGTKTSILFQKFLPAAMNFKPYTQFYVYIDRHTHTHTHIHTKDTKLNHTSRGAKEKDGRKKNSLILLLKEFWISAVFIELFVLHL